MREGIPNQPAVDPATWGGYMPRPPVLSSDGFKWKNLRARRYHHIPAKFSAPALDHHLVTFFLEGSTPIDWKLSGETIKGHVTPGKMLLMAAGQDSRWDWSGSPDVLHAYLDPDFMSQMALEVGIHNFNLADGLDIEDPVLYGLGKQLLHELENPSYGGDIIGEALSHMIAIRLIRAHSAGEVKNVQTTVALPAWRLKRVLDAIEDRLETGTTLDELATVAGLSKYHFARSFKSATGTPPHRYILERRLHRARGLLKDSDLPIAEIALMSGFASQEHLTTCFRRHLGSTPASYRRNRRA